jgi:hypothetical protein
MLVLVMLLVVVLSGAWVLYQFVGPYNTLRRHVLNQVGVVRLQEWAVSVLDNPPSMYAPIGPQRRLRTEDIPSDIEQLASSCMIIYNPARYEVGVQEHILFACGSGFYHYGLRVGRTGYEPAHDSQFYVEKIGDGVWGLYER